MMGAMATLVLFLFSACAPVEQAQQEEEYYEKIPVIDAYYNGEKLWFIHTDVTSPEMAERLTKMVNYKTLYVPAHAEAIEPNKLAKLYLFANGVDQRDTEPWGGGPFNYQIDIFDSIPGDEGYTSLRQPHVVTWTENTTPRILKSEEELLAAEAAGELAIKPTGVVVNVPVVRWPGGSARLE